MVLDLPTISIVTPSFNQAAFIERAIQSVLDQDYPNIEYIVIDGGSTDGSVDIIRKYQDRLKYWVSEDDRGQTHALNKGFKMATGEITAWLNSDDMYPPGIFRTIADVFSHQPDLDMVYGDQFVIDESDRIISESRFTKIWYPMIMFGNVLPQTAAFWKRSLFNRVGYLDESLRFVMDREFMCRVARKARLKHIRKHAVLFRIHPAQKSQTIRDVGLQEGESIRERYGKGAYGRWPPVLVKQACNLVKAAYFVLDGNGWYALWRGLRRLYWVLRKGARPF